MNAFAAPRCRFLFIAAVALHSSSAHGGGKMEPCILSKFNGDVNTLVFSPDGSFLVTGGGPWHGPGEWILWDVATGAQLLKVDKHRAAIWALAFSPDGKLLATGGGDGEAKIWTVRDGTLQMDLVGHRLYVSAIRFFPDGRRLVTAAQDSSVRVWAVANGTPLARFVFPFVDAMWEEFVSAEVPKEKAQMTVRFKLEANGFSDLKLSPDGHTLAAVTLGSDTVQVWDVATGAAKMEVKLQRQETVPADFSTDKSLILVRDGGHTLETWDIESRRRKSVVGGEKDACYSTLSGDSRRLASLAGDGTLRVWDIRLKKEICRLPRRRTFFGPLIAISPDNATLAVRESPNVHENGQWDKPFIEVWDLHTGKKKIYPEPGARKSGSFPTQR